jgi:hypothetical protein
MTPEETMNTIENLTLEELNGTKWKCGDRVFELTTEVKPEGGRHYARVIFKDTSNNTMLVLESPRWGDDASERFARMTTSKTVEQQIVFAVFPEVKDQYLWVDDGKGSNMCIVNPDAPDIDTMDAKYQVTPA